MTAHDLSRWEPASPTEVGERLAAADSPWWIAGGWAIEFAVGAPFRAHADIDVLLLRRDQLAAQRALPDWEWWAAEPPGTLRPWASGEILPPGVHDVWCRPDADAPWRVQFMLDEAEGAEWVSRRDPRIRRPVKDIGLVNADGLPYLAPEIQLLYKAKGARPKDERDFATVLPRLDAAQRRRLREAMALAYGGHPWSRRLADLASEQAAVRSARYAASISVTPVSYCRSGISDRRRMTGPVASLYLRGMRIKTSLILGGEAVTAAAFGLSDLVNREYSPVAETVSRFVNTDHGWLVSVGLYAFAIAAAGLAVAVRERADRVLFGILAVGILLAALFPADPPGQWANPSTSEQVHGLAAWIGLICLNVGALRFSRRNRRTGLLPVAIAAAVAMGLFMVCTFDAMLFRELPNLIGLTERLAIAADLAWMCLAARAIRRN